MSVLGDLSRIGGGVPAKGGIPTSGGGTTRGGEGLLIDGGEPSLSPLLLLITSSRILISGALSAALLESLGFGLVVLLSYSFSLSESLSLSLSLPSAPCPFILCPFILCPFSELIPIAKLAAGPFDTIQLPTTGFLLFGGEGLGFSGDRESGGTRGGDVLRVKGDGTGTEEEEEAGARGGLEVLRGRSGGGVGGRASNGEWGGEAWGETVGVELGETVGETIGEVLGECAGEDAMRGIGEDEGGVSESGGGAKYSLPNAMRCFSGIRRHIFSNLRESFA